MDLAIWLVINTKIQVWFDQITQSFTLYTGLSYFCYNTYTHIIHFLLLFKLEMSLMLFAFEIPEQMQKLEDCKKLMSKISHASPNLKNTHICVKLLYIF